MYDAQQSSPTAIACEQAQLFGATPGPDEPDNRDLWDEDDAMHAVDSAFHGFANDVARDGTQLADERESFLWGFVNLFHAQVNRLDRAVDALKPKLRDLERAQDGTEINAWELERTVDRARALGDRRDAFEKMRDHAASAYREATGSTWRPRRGSHVSQTAKLTSAAIDARDFLRAREHRANEAHLPDGTLVAVAGGKESGNVDAICSALDRVKERHPDMVLVHGGGLAYFIILLFCLDKFCDFKVQTTFQTTRFHAQQRHSIFRLAHAVASQYDPPHLGSCQSWGIAMLSNHGDIEMRILSKRQLKELVLYSPQHISRLEKAGRFPKRVQLGPNRVGWVEDEVLDWLRTRMDGRETPARHS